jgi:hypothetical protein
MGLSGAAETRPRERERGRRPRRPLDAPNAWTPSRERTVWAPHVPKIRLPPVPTSSRQAGLVWDVFAFIARWALAVGFLSIAVGVLVRIAPATHQPLPWVSLGTTIVTVWG